MANAIAPNPTSNTDLRVLCQDPITRSYAAALAKELAAASHTVVLIPAPRQAHRCHKVRLAVEFLPDWYRDFMGGYTSRRTDRRKHHQTAIKRRHTLAGLRSIAQGRPGTYAARLLDLIAAERLTDEREEMAREMGAAS